MGIDLALDEWRRLLGEASVLGEGAAMATYGADASAITRRIPAALQVADGTLVPEIVRIANRNAVSLYPISTGKNWGYGTALPAQDDCVILDLSRMRKILHFDQDLGVITLEPGVTQAMLAEFLDSGGHEFLVPVTGAGPQCSLVGNALERGYGITPFVDHFGAVTDIEAVLADGAVYRTALNEAGGEDLARLFKWGIGPYSAGLFTQSGFGIVTKMTIALARRPECIKVCLFSLKEDHLLERAIERIRSILSILPGTVGGINLMNRHRVLAMSAPFPAEQLGSDGMIPESVIEELGRQYQVFPWTGFGTLYGTKRIVAAAQKEIRKRLSGIASRLLFLSPQNAKMLSSMAHYLPGASGRRLAGTLTTLAQSLELVAGRPNETALPLCYWRNPMPPSASLRDPSRDGCGLIWYAPLVPMRPGGVREYVQMVTEVTLRHRIEPLITLTSINDKLFDSTVPLIFEHQNKDAVDAATACYKDLLTTGRGMGVFPYRVGISSMRVLQEYLGASAAFHSKLAAAIDPGGVIAPGRYR